MLLLLTGALTFFRLIFAIVFYDETVNLTYEFFFKSILLGFRFDLRLSILMIFPYLFFSWIPIINTQIQENIWKLYWLLIGGLITVCYIIDLGYYAYVDTRLDASIIGLVKNFSISMMMVWESYPIIPGIIIILSLLWIYFLLIKKVYTKSAKKSCSFPLIKSVGIHFIIIISFLAICYGKWSGYPLRWSDAFYSTNHFANQLTINPILYFLNSYSWREQGYDLESVKKSYNILANYIGVKEKNETNFSFKRSIDTNQQLYNKTNVIIIILETFPTYKIGYFGNPLNPTPYFDEIARKSIIFTNFYVPKFSTAGSVFSAMTGLPDVATVNKTSTNDPFSFKQHLLINDLQDYKKHFFIGGSANWADIGGFFRRNVDDILIHEEGSYTANSVNAWGISDYDLMMEANKIIKKEKEPFISIILTAGNHSPYTIPKINKFERINFTNEHKKYGFVHEKELNAFRFMDFSLGEFIRSAKKENYYKNTIFVILGDHGMGHESKQNNYGALSLHNYHVPLTIYSPGLNILYEEIDKVVSSIDLMPTIMGLLNVPYTNTSLGRDILSDKSYPSYSFLFTASNSTYGLISNDYFVYTDVMGKHLIYNKKDETLLNYINPEIENMIKLNEGYYHISKYLRYNNE